MSKKVSIIIPVYNGADFLKEAIDSALGQTYSNIEVIVVNDGSNDGNKTRDIAMSYGQRIMYYEKNNGGVSSALNYGIEKMTGEYFSWLSHDDIYLPEKIEAEIDLIENQSCDNAVVYTNFAFMKMPERRILKSPGLCERFSESSLTDGMLATALWIIYGCSLLIPKSLFLKYGGFNEDYRCVQDYLKWFELFNDEKLLYVDRVLVYSRTHLNQQTFYLSDKLRLEEELVLSHVMEQVVLGEYTSKVVDSQQLLCVLIEKAIDLNSPAIEYGRKLLAQIEDYDLTILRQKEFIQKVLGNNGIICIYGAGIRGKKNVKRLLRCNILIDYFIDRNKTLWHTFIEGVECIGIEELHDKEAIIIVSVEESKEIILELRERGYKNVYRYEDIEGKIALLPFCSKDI